MTGRTSFNIPAQLRNKVIKYKKKFNKGSTPKFNPHHLTKNLIKIYPPSYIMFTYVVINYRCELIY